MKKIQRRKVKRMVFYKGTKSKEMEDMEPLSRSMMNRRLDPFLPHNSDRWERIKSKRFWYLPPYTSKMVKDAFPMGEEHVNWKPVYKKRIYMHPADFIEAAGWGPPSGVDRELTQKVAGKKTRVDVPYLMVNEDGHVIDHNGRHRASAALEVGMKMIPVIILYDEWDGYNRFMRQYSNNKVKQQRARKRTMLDRAVRMVRG